MKGAFMRELVAYVICAIVSMVRRRGRGGCCGDCDKCRDQNNKINR